MFPWSYVKSQLGPNMHSERTYLPGLNIGAGLRAGPGIVVDLSMISFGAVISEGNNPGDNALMRMGIPFNARSFAITFVMCVRAAFEAAYANCGRRVYY